MNIIEITEDFVGERVDKFLSEALNITRSQVQSRFKKELVFINGNKGKKNHILSLGDQIEMKEEVLVSEEGEEKQEEFNPEIISEEEDYFVINKPSGMAVHPDSKNKGNTLVNFLLKKFPEIKTVGDDKNRPGIVHRLDQGVSGVMVSAKTNSFFEDVKEQFKNRTVEKKYIALVYGEVQDNEGEIVFRIGRSKTNKTRMAAMPLGSEEGEEAISSYKVLKRFHHATLLEVEIKTGRTHQIRVHLNALGHSVVGDYKYSNRGLKRTFEIDRIFLHSKSLSFFDAKGVHQTFSAKLPDSLNSFLETLKEKS